MTRSVMKAPHAPTERWREPPIRSSSSGHPGPSKLPHGMGSLAQPCPADAHRLNAHQPACEGCCSGANNVGRNSPHSVGHSSMRGAV